MLYLESQLIKKLQETSSITNLVSTNFAWTNKSKKGNKQKKHSILPVRYLVAEMETPFVTVDSGGDNSLGLSRLAQLFIRVYDDRNNGVGFSLMRLADIVRNTLNQEHIAYEGEYSQEIYEFEYVGQQPIRQDEAYELDYIELEFRVTNP